MEDTPLIIVDTADKLQEMVEALADEPVLGIDTEADSMHRYREKVCLIQLSDRTTDYIVDPLAGFPLEPLAPMMSDPDRVKIFHGADYDVVSLRRDFGWTFKNLFDTMISAQILGLPKVGLADLCKSTFGVHMDKKYQTHDWARRPLYDEHLDYARGDTHFLLALREMLLRKLKRADRMDVATEEFEALEDREWKGPTMGDPGRFLKMKGANKLDQRSLQVLRALWTYRDGKAAAADRPPYKVVPDPVLVQVATRKPKNMDDLSQVMRAKSTMYKRHGEALLKAVEAGLVDDRELPKPFKKVKVGTKPRYGARETDRLFTQLKAWRTGLTSGKKGLPPAMVGSNSTLKGIAGFRPHDKDELHQVIELRNWQINRYGDELLDIIQRFEQGLPPRQAQSAPGEGSSSRRRRRRKTSSD
ncbi:MAG: ribonuclease D [Proteobacteria bacterium]|nr:ribonuclease D [Pseudomonadota bacterium]MCP4920403.1 ribonuclease D [Pseudomonadota bacterium]